jgi:hypothetical protein
MDSNANGGIATPFTHRHQPSGCITSLERDFAQHPGGYCAVRNFGAVVLIKAQLTIWCYNQKNG